MSDGVPKNTSLVELLDQLIIPDAPEPVSMMPQTVGWAIVGAVLALVLGWLGWRWLRDYRANAYRRAALLELSQAGDDPATIAEILRRTALVAYDRTTVASLSGAAWIAFLERTGQTPWEPELSALLQAGPYRAQIAPSQALTAQASRWIKAHKPEDSA